MCEREREGSVIYIEYKTLRAAKLDKWVACLSVKPLKLAFFPLQLVLRKCDITPNLFVFLTITNEVLFLCHAPSEHRRS